MTPKQLAKSGLGADSQFADVVFNLFVFKYGPGDSMATAVSVSKDNNNTTSTASLLTLGQPSVANRHKLDTPELREKFWEENKLGTFCVRSLNNLHNTYSSDIRNLLRKLVLSLNFAFPVTQWVAITYPFMFLLVHHAIVNRVAVACC